MADEMSDELKDFRGRITALAWAYLEAEARAHGRDQQEIVREVLHAWAVRKHEAANVAQRLLKSTGKAGEA